MNGSKYEDVLHGDDLSVFTENMKKFNQAFCDMMVEHSEFVLKLEVRGDKGTLTHCRVVTDGLMHPKGRKRQTKENRIAHKRF